MISDIFSFLVLFFLILLLFSCVGMVLFDQIPEFGNFTDSIILLFTYSLGEFSFDPFAPEGALGQVYLTAYLIIGLIILLNLLIAILSSTYSILESRSVGLYLERIIEEQEMWEYHEKSNFYTMRCIPCNVFSLCFFKCADRTSRSNHFSCSLLLEILVYIPVFLVSGLLLLAADVVFAIPAYISLLLRALDAKDCRSFWFIFFLFPILVPVFAVMDCIRFYSKMWEFSPQLRRQVELKTK